MKKNNTNFKTVDKQAVIPSTCKRRPRAFDVSASLVFSNCNVNPSWLKGEKGGIIFGR